MQEKQEGPYLRWERERRTGQSRRKTHRGLYTRVRCATRTKNKASGEPGQGEIKAVAYVASDRHPGHDPRARRAHPRQH